MGRAFLLVLVVPWLQHFFALKLVGVTMPWIGGRHRGGGGGHPGARVEVGGPPRSASAARRRYFTSTKSPVALTAGVVVVPAKE